MCERFLLLLCVMMWWYLKMCCGWRVNITGVFFWFSFFFFNTIFVWFVCVPFAVCYNLSDFNCSKLTQIHKLHASQSQYLKLIVFFCLVIVSTFISTYYISKLEFFIQIFIFLLISRYFRYFHVFITFSIYTYSITKKKAPSHRLLVVFVHKHNLHTNFSIFFDRIFVCSFILL